MSETLEKIRVVVAQLRLLGLGGGNGFCDCVHCSAAREKFPGTAEIALKSLNELLAETVAKQKAGA